MFGAKKIGFSIASMVILGGVLAGCGTNASGGNQSTSNNGTPAASSSSKTVKIGYVDWSEDVATSYLWQDLLQKKGYTVQLTSLEAGPLFSGLSQGGVDVFFDTWLPTTHKQYMQRYGSNLVALGKWYQGTTNEGFVVPKYMTNINTISDLEKNASAFNNQVVGIDPGAGEMQLAKTAMSSYGLTKMNLVSSSSAAMLSALKQAYDTKTPIAVTLWSPHWAFAKYQLKYLSDPKNIFGSAGWIQTEANKQWASQNTQVATWLKNFKLTPTQLGTLEVDINNASSKNAGVEKWIGDNQSVVNSWFTS